MADPGAVRLCRDAVHGRSSVGRSIAEHCRPAVLADPGLCDDDRCRAGYHDQPLSLLLAGVRGGGRGQSGPGQRPAEMCTEDGPIELERIELDTLVGMAFSNLVALAIMLTAAATLHPANITNIETSAQAARRCDRSPENMHRSSSRWESSEPACLPSRYSPDRRPTRWAKLSASRSARQEGHARPRHSMAQSSPPRSSVPNQPHRDRPDRSPLLVGSDQRHRFRAGDGDDDAGGKPPGYHGPFHHYRTSQVARMAGDNPDGGRGRRHGAACRSRTCSSLDIDRARGG